MRERKMYMSDGTKRCRLIYSKIAWRFCDEEKRAERQEAERERDSF